MDTQTNGGEVPILSDADKMRAAEIAHNLVLDRNKVIELENRISSLLEQIKMLELERDHAHKLLRVSKIENDFLKTQRDEALMQRTVIETNLLGLCENGKDLIRHMEELTAKLIPISLQRPELPDEQD
jgi:hypothetical protein